jgi:hydroxypyruvate reductase
MMHERQLGGLLLQCLRAGIQAVHPRTCLQPCLPCVPEKGRIILLAGGKAAGAMMKTACRHYLQRLEVARISGVAVHHHEPLVDLPHVEQISAGHPVPDENSQRGALRVLELARSAGPDDLVVVLLSGGASSLWSAPIEGVSLAEKQKLTRSLLRSGANISEINGVRKHLSIIKGGRLAKMVAPARLVTFAISDVVGDDPSIIASGPTVGDPTTLAEARKVLERYDIQPPQGIGNALSKEANETPGPNEALFGATQYHCVANGSLALRAARRLLVEHKIRVINLGDRIEGEARDIASEHAQLALDLQDQQKLPVALLSGGELTVTLKGAGTGGPSQEYALALTIALEQQAGGRQGIFALAADTDGCDGGAGKAEDPAGALVFPSTLQRAQAKKLNPATFLQHNDSGQFFKKLGDLVMTGPTYTNVNDFRIILVNRNETG